MKLLITLSLLMSISTHADDSKKTERLERIKKISLEQIDATVSLLQKSRACVSSAHSREDLKNCRQEAKAEKKKMKKEFKSKRRASKKLQQGK